MARVKFYNKETGKWEYADSAYGSGGTVTDEQIASAVEDYMAEHPIEGGSGIHIGAEAPTDDSVSVWIDTDEEAEVPSGVSSWNDLTDKPFGVEKVDVNPYFDNDLTGRTVLPMAEGVNLVKITDHVLTEAECIGAVMTLVGDGTEATETISENGVIDVSAQFGISSFMVCPDAYASYGTPFVAVVRNPGTVQGLEVSAGTYYLSADNTQMYVSHFSALDNLEIVKKLDTKYLPDGVPYTEIGKVVILPEGEYTDDAGWSFHDDDFPENAAIDQVYLTEGATYAVTFNGVAYECVCATYMDEDGSTSYTGIGNPQVLHEVGASNGIVDVVDNGMPFFMDVALHDVKYSPTIFTLNTERTTITVGITTVGEVVHKLDEKYIPDTIAKVSDITAAIMGAMEASY